MGWKKIQLKNWIAGSSLPLIREFPFFSSTFCSEVPTVHTDGFVDWFDDVLQLLRKDFPNDPSFLPKQNIRKIRKIIPPGPFRDVHFVRAIVFDEESMWCATLNYFLSLQTISHDERLKSDAWHGNALLSCGPHKLVPQQKLSEFNGELVARPKVSIFFCVFSFEWWKLKVLGGFGWRPKSFKWSFINICKVSVSLQGFLWVGEILLMEEIRLTSYYVGYPII